MPLTRDTSSALTLQGCGRTGSDNASDKIVTCRVASNYPFAKLMEIAESVPTGRV